MDLKAKRIEQVVEAAVEVFKEKGIENSRLTDIAERAEVGIASLYRYFNSKPELAVAAAGKVWEEEISLLYNRFNSEQYHSLCGLEQVKAILMIFIELYEHHQPFIRFIDEFDNYVIKERITQEKLQAYEKRIISLMSVFSDAVIKGKLDGSIRCDIEVESLYFTLTHSLMSLCQKLIIRGAILTSDINIKGSTQIELLIDMSIKYLENK